MEAQPNSDYSNPENSQNSQHPLNNCQFIEVQTDFNIQLQRLISEGIPVFVFEERSQKEINQSYPKQNDEKSQYLNERILTYNRKAKSLQELSKRFIEQFQGKNNNIIQLDKITKVLGVERRRIYDVINILESLNVVTKKGKNIYEWKGLCEAVTTINDCSKEGQNFKIQNFKKEKSLEYLASGFLKLFINWKPAISLEEAAKHMMKQMQDAAVKTKIRRLYDIINVFRSLGLVRKATLPSKKPGYEWAGTEQLQHLIIKKQQCEEITRMTELRQEEDIQNPEEKSSSIFQVKNGMFSPLICPQIPKWNIANFKLLNFTKDPKDSEGQKSEYKYFNQDLFIQAHQFPIFRRTTSAFTLVAEGKKQHQ